MSKWWEEPVRAVQTNLQVTDARVIDAERLAQQLVELGANALVFNVGGIYAWYPTEVLYHTVNPMLEDGRDLVGEITAACRRRGIRLIARYDFSKATDNTYRQHPEWFVRLADNKPQMVAVDRMGEWPQLVSTCLNGGYQNDEVAFRVLKESMERYHPDGIFITSMIYAPCQCEACRAVYRKLYGAEIPADPTQYVPGFAERMMDESVLRYEKAVKAIDPDAAFLHRVMLSDGRTDQKTVYQQTRWWFPKTGDYDLFFDHPIDWVHAETHNGLNGGRKAIGPRWGSGVAVKLARCVPGVTQPLDIVHTAPGLGWRHTGMPTAEHRFWAAQVPANGGQIWHSLTGVPDTIVDKAQLETVRWINERIAKVQPLMHRAESAASIALLWNDLGGHGWAEGLTGARIPFDLLLKRQAEEGISSRYRYVVCPERTQWTEPLVSALVAYARQGGGLVLEGRVDVPALCELAGLQSGGQESELLQTSYLRVEDAALRRAADVAELVPFTGWALYRGVTPDTRVLATLVPPFAPPEGAGSPPERATLPKVEVPWPMIARRGNVVSMAVPYHDLLEKYSIAAHVRLLDALLDGERLVRVNAFAGLQLTVFRCEGGYMAHLVNGVGERPLQTVTKLHGVELTVTLPENETFVSADWMFGGEPVRAEREGRGVRLALPPVDSWEAVFIRVREG